MEHPSPSVSTLVCNTWAALNYNNRVDLPAYLTNAHNPDNKTRGDDQPGQSCIYACSILSIP